MPKYWMFFYLNRDGAHFVTHFLRETADVIHSPHTSITPVMWEGTEKQANQLLENLHAAEPELMWRVELVTTHPLLGVS
jgi:hypothetical protein